MAQLSNIDELRSLYSDLFKDVNGFRPRGILMPDTEEELQRRIDELADAINDDDDFDDSDWMWF